MILILGPAKDPMIKIVVEAVRQRKRPHALVYTESIPGSVRLRLELGERLSGDLLVDDGPAISLDEVRGIYHRVGFANFEAYTEYSEDELRFVNAECSAALYGFLNCTPALVINRPVESGSNASKPYQVALIEQYGFSAPRTLVTNLPETARDFFHFLEGRVIYKSISYIRSIVQVMTEDDLDRLDTLKNCPVQLQEQVAGTDIRVHVVGYRDVFATRIKTCETDYRYDKTTELEPWELPEKVAQQCRDVARGLGLALAGIDLRVTAENRYYCFEVNPSPAFQWYENRTGQPISGSLADLLIEADGAY